MTRTARQPNPINPDSIPTRWFAWVDFNGGKSSASAGGNTLPELIADIYMTASYYASVRPDDKITLRGLCRMSVACDGTGAAPRKGRIPYRRKPCPACKGHGILREYNPIALVLSGGVKITNDCL